MTDPEAQLRRLAEGRAGMVDPFSADEIDRPDATEPVAAVVELAPRRWPTAVAAAFLAIVAVGAGVIAVLVGPDGDDRTDLAGRDGLADHGAADEDAADTTSSTVAPDVSIPDVVGQDADDAAAQLREIGVQVRIDSLFVAGDDARLGEVVEVKPGSGAEGQIVEVVVARLAPSLRSTDPCLRPPHVLGNFDDDLLVDRVYPRFRDGRLVEVEICTGTGVRTALGGLSLERVEFAGDLDGDGVDEIVVSADESGTDHRVLALVDDRLVERALTDYEVVLELVEPEDACAVRELDVALRGDVDGDGEPDLLAPRDGIACLAGGAVISLGEAVADAEIWFLDDIDDDGVLELFVGQSTVDEVRVRPYAIAADGTIAAVADDDCCVQSALTVAGPRPVPDTTGTDGTESTDPDGPDPDTAGPDTAGPDTAGPDTAGPSDADPGDDADDADPVPAPVDGAARWFSCVAAGPDHPAGLVSGRFWIDVEVGVVEWTVDVGAAADVDVIHSATFDDPLATDAWIPGNGCRRSVGAWQSPVPIEFGDDGGSTAESVDAFNRSIAGDDPGLRVVRLREALGIADLLVDAAGPYREDLAEGLLELRGVPLDDGTTAAVRWEFVFADDGTTLLSVARAWACGADGAEPSPEPCR